MTISHTEYLAYRAKQLEEEHALFRKVLSEKYPDLVPLIDEYIEGKDDSHNTEYWETDRDRADCVLTQFMCFLGDRQS